MALRADLSSNPSAIADQKGDLSHITKRTVISKNPTFRLYLGLIQTHIVLSLAHPSPHPGEQEPGSLANLNNQGQLQWHILDMQVK